MSTATARQGTQNVQASPASGPAEDITVQDPRDGSLVGTVRSATRADVHSAVRAARRSLSLWRSTPAEERGRILRSAAAALAAHADELSELNGRETGRPREEALAGIEAAVHTLEQYAELGPVHRGHSLRGGITSADYTLREPRGVVVALTPWNDPAAVAAGLLGAALVTGNTVIHKPSERCPHFGLRLGEILTSALPDGVLTTVSGGGRVGAWLTQEPGVDVLAHVGSSATGRLIAGAGAESGAHVIRENGGNDALIVDADVDPQWAAEQTATGAFSNVGQICTAVERIYVHRDIADAFCAALTAQAQQRNRQPAAPLVDERLRSEVHRQVSDAVARGAAATEGGSIPDRPGAWYPATVLTGCTGDMAVMTEETFGPVAPVQVVGSFDEALELAAADRYGLAANVLTTGIERAHRAIAALPVGTVKVNSVFGGAPGGAAQPRRDSGSGFGYGPELMDEMTTVKVVHVGLPGGAQ